MPLEFKTNIKPVGNLGVWKIEEPESFFLDQLALAADEADQLNLIKGQRRLEWLASRHLIHLLSERKIRGSVIKDSYGKPYLTDSRWEISMSHTLSFAAVIAAPFAVGVDIQQIVPGIDRIRHKFMHGCELEYLEGNENDLMIMHVIWGIKESLFKAYGKGALSWTENFRVEAFEYAPGGGEVLCWMNDNKNTFFYTGTYQLYKGVMLCYVQAIDNPRN